MATYPLPFAYQGFKVIWYINYGSIFGWEEDYFWAGDNSTFDGVAADIAVMSAAKRQYLSELAHILAVKAIPWPDENRASRLFAGPAYGGNGARPYFTNGNPPFNGLMVYLRDRTGQVRRNFLIRGLPYQSFRWTPTVEWPPLTPQGMNDLAPLFALLGGSALPVGPPRNAPSSAGRWCLRATSRDPAVVGRQQVTAFGPGPGQCGTLVTTPTPPEWGPGDWLQLGGMKASNLTGLPGRTPVLSVAGNVTLIPREAACCPPWCWKPGMPWVYRRQEALYAIESIAVSRVMPHDARGPFRWVTWAPTDPELVAWHPCGMKIDLLKTCYRTPMQTWASGAPAVPVVWFDAPPDAAVYSEPCAFRSRHYIDPFAPWSGLGEQVECCWRRQPCQMQRYQITNQPWYSGKPPAPYIGLSPCPPDDRLAEFGGIKV